VREIERHCEFRRRRDDQPRLVGGLLVSVSRVSEAPTVGGYYDPSKDLDLPPTWAAPQPF